jgi:hypothetical protein
MKLPIHIGDTPHLPALQLPIHDTPANKSLTFLPQLLLTEVPVRKTTVSQGLPVQAPTEELRKREGTVGALEDPQAVITRNMIVAHVMSHRMIFILDPIEHVITAKDSYTPFLTHHRR